MSVLPNAKLMRSSASMMTMNSSTVSRSTASPPIWFAAILRTDRESAIQSFEIALPSLHASGFSQLRLQL
jgi:hypothetical protein